MESPGLMDVPNEVLLRIIKHVPAFIHHGLPLDAPSVAAQFQALRLSSMRVKQLLDSVTFKRELLEIHAPVLHRFYITGDPALSTMMLTVRVESLVSHIVNAIIADDPLSESIENEKQILMVGIPLLSTLLSRLVETSDPFVKDARGYPRGTERHAGLSHRMLQLMPSYAGPLVTYTWWRLSQGGETFRALVRHMFASTASPAIVWASEPDPIRKELCMVFWVFIDWFLDRNLKPSSRPCDLHRHSQVLGWMYMQVKNKKRILSSLPGCSHAYKPIATRIKFDKWLSLVPDLRLREYDEKLAINYHHNRLGQAMLKAKCLISLRRDIALACYPYRGAPAKPFSLPPPSCFGHAITGGRPLPVVVQELWLQLRADKHAFGSKVVQKVLKTGRLKYPAYDRLVTTSLRSRQIRDSTDTIDERVRHEEYFGTRMRDWEQKAGRMLCICFEVLIATVIGMAVSILIAIAMWITVIHPSPTSQTPLVKWLRIFFSPFYMSLVAFMSASTVAHSHWWGHL